MRQILMVPDKLGNISTTQETAVKIQNFLLVELEPDTYIWTDFSGSGPPPGAFGNAMFWNFDFSK